MRKRILFALAAALLAGCAAAPEKRIPEIQQAVAEAGRKKDIPALEKLAVDIPDAWLAPERLAGYPEDALGRLYVALRAIAFYTPDSEANALRLEKVFRERVSRGNYDADQVEQVYSALLAAGLFGSARDMKERFPAILTAGLPETVVPDPPPSGNWLAWELSRDGKTARLKSLRLSRGAHVVMAFSPGCGVTERAVLEILADPELGPVFKAEALLVSRRFDADGVKEAKEKFGLDRLYIARKWGDFPGVNFMTSPWIFFLKDGKVVSEMRGWADDGAHSLGRLRRGMADIGYKLEQAD